MAKKRMCFGVFLLLFSIFGYIETYSIHERIKMEVSAAFFPRVVLGTLGVLGLVLIIKGFKEYKLGDSQEEDKKEKIHYKLLFLSLVTCIGYGFLLKPLGFITASILFMILQMWIMSNQMTGKKFIRNACISIPLVLVLYYLFTTVFFVPLP